MIFYIAALIIFLFSIIHFLEFTSFYSRIAGIETGFKLISYSIQQTTFVGTRFFFIFLMPLLGFVVDHKIEKITYLYMIYFSLLGASLAYVFAFLLRRRIIDTFSKVIFEFNGGHGYIYSFYSGLKFFFLSKRKKILKNKEKNCINSNILFSASIIFCCYSIAVFLSFYFALHFYNYRSSISQLSGIINAFATLVLTLYIEPKISKSMDNKSSTAKSEIYSLLIGRFIGVFIFSPIIVFFVVRVL